MSDDLQSELDRARERIAELEAQLDTLSRELEATNEGVVALYTDLDDAQTALTEKSRQVQEADRLKSEFLANMSHEIRTPMNAILGLTEVLLKTALDDSQRESLCVIQEAGRALLNLINDILDFSKIEAGMLTLEKVEFAPASLFGSTLDLLRGLAENKGLALRLVLDEDLPASMRGDPHRLRQILLNLVGNAIKFTEAGSVTVMVSLLDPPGLRVSVNDTGSGMSQEVREKLFRPFSQGDGSVTRQHGGTGLGLSICKRLVDLMGGELGLESVPGEGSTFWFCVPLQPGASGTVLEPEQGDPGELPPVQPGARILVAEDHPANQFVARQQLRSLGLEADFVSNGREAMEAALTRPYDLVLMDCQMPEMSGFEATREIRLAEQASGQHLPIVALTAGALEGDREACLEAGMDDYLAKPVEARRLAEVLARWLPVVIPGARSECNHRNLVDFEALENTFGREFVPELARLFIQDAGQEVTGLRRATEGGDEEGVALHAHGIGGLAAAIRAHTLVSHSERLRKARKRGDWEQIRELSSLLEQDYAGVCEVLRERYLSAP